MTPLEATHAMTGQEEGHPSWVQQAYEEWLVAMQAEAEHADKVADALDAYRNDPKFGRALYDSRMETAIGAFRQLCDAMTDNADGHRWGIVVGDALAATMYDIRAEPPPYIDPDKVSAQEAKYWAETATAPELLAYGAAALDQMTTRSLPIPLLHRVILAVLSRLERKWAQEASQDEFDAMVGPIIAVVSRAHGAEKARKRIVAAMWRGMSQDSRAAFLDWAKKEDGK